MIRCFTRVRQITALLYFLLSVLSIPSTYAAEGDQATPTPPKTLPSPQLVEKEGGIYVVAKTYSPQIPQDLPKDTKPSQYLSTLALDRTQWNPGDTIILWIGPKWSGSQSPSEMFRAGQKIALPVKLMLTDSQGKQHEISGTLLLEVTNTFASTAELDKTYPSKPGQERSFYKFDAANGTFSHEEKNADLKFSMTMTGGPLESGWSDEAKRSNIQFYSQFYESLGCFVATAVYHSWAIPQLCVLREFRDKVMSRSEAGTRLLTQYYRLGPTWAVEVKQHPYLQAALRPMISSLAWLLSWLPLDSPTTLALCQPAFIVLDWTLTPWMQQQNSQISFDPELVIPHN